MTWPLAATAAALMPSGSTARRDRTTRSYLIGLPPAEARRAVRRVRRLVLAADPAGVSLRQLREQDRAVDVEPQPLCIHSSIIPLASGAPPTSPALFTAGSFPRRSSVAP